MQEVYLVVREKRRLTLRYSFRYFSILLMNYASIACNVLCNIWIHKYRWGFVVIN